MGEVGSRSVSLEISPRGDHAGVVAHELADHAVGGVDHIVGVGAKAALQLVPVLLLEEQEEAVSLLGLSGAVG